MDPENGLLALARVGVAITRALGAAKEWDFEPNPLEPWWHVYPNHDELELNRARFRREVYGDWVSITRGAISYGDGI